MRQPLFNYAAHIGDEASLNPGVITSPALPDYLLICGGGEGGRDGGNWREVGGAVLGSSTATSTKSMVSSLIRPAEPNPLAVIGKRSSGSVL